MDAIARWYVRTALIWMVLGFALGGLLLLDAQLPGDWRRWFQPTHGHILFVGWFFSFAVGIAYWLLPRRRSPTQPLGYNERMAFIGWGGLHGGLALRVIGEPLQRADHDGSLVVALLIAASIAQFGAACIVAAHLWQRVMPRPTRAAAQAMAEPKRTGTDA